MKIIIYLTLLCFGTWGLAAGLIGHASELLWAMLGPWGVGVLTLWSARRTYERDPEQLTGLMLKSFVGKMIFYGIYITLLIVFSTISKVPFIIGFAVYFIVLHIIEALYFQSIFKPKKS